VPWPVRMPQLVAGFQISLYVVAKIGLCTALADNRRTVEHLAAALARGPPCHGASPTPWRRWESSGQPRPRRPCPSVDCQNHTNGVVLGHPHPPETGRRARTGWLEVQPDQLLPVEVVAEE
jgi:hypothetical protein